jgi:hypothetical protein
MRDAAALGMLIVVAQIAFFVFTIVFMILVLNRLKTVVDEIIILNRQMMAIRFPNLPWPALPGDVVVAYDVRDGVKRRMWGDGRWEFASGGRWQPEPPAPSFDGRA